MNRIDIPLIRNDEQACGGVHAMRGSSSSSLARVRLRALVCALSVFSLCFALMAQPALAATWPVPTSGLSATLAFHQSYTAGIESYVHSGIDIPASAGMQISSPLAGTVRFTGAVPSGDSRCGGTSSAKTMNAVSIELQDGKVVTLMPFAAIDVREGQAVAEGARLGTLAASGDVSTPATHVHMGYKQGSTYLDPMLLFGTAASSARKGAAAGFAAAPAASAAAPTAADPASAGLAADVPAVAAQEEIATTSVPEGASAVEAFGAIETGAYKPLQQGSRASAPAGFISGAFGWLADACATQLTNLADALGALAQNLGITVPALVAGMVALAPCAVLALCFVCVRHFRSRLRKILEHQRACLSSCNGGGSMHKLFPASGAAFMSRSRIAQRR